MNPGEYLQDSFLLFLKNCISLTQEEFKSLFDKHFDEVRNYIYYRSGDKELATDIAQETFLKMWEKQFDIQNNKVKGLLYKIAGNIFSSNYRHQKVEMNFKLQLKENEPQPSPEEQIQFKELTKQYEMALAGMPEKHRTVFLMSRMDKLKYSEIAENLDLSVKAVEKRMSQALSFLKIKMNQ